MAYEYHVFLSYRRYGEWPEWVSKVFLPIFKHWLGEELGEDVRVFFDQDMESGVPWPTNLGHALAHSRVLVPLLSKQYFTSRWCQAELSHMLARQKSFGVDTLLRGLIVPATIHDGQDLPSDIAQITRARLEDYTNIRLAKNSPTEEELSRRIRDWVPHIAHAIYHVPECDPEWRNLAIDEFISLFATTQAKQRTLPSLGDL
jgi:hypothetical protein